MADKKKGFIPLFRSIQDHWLWKDQTPFDYRSAWIDLILSVNHKEDKRKIKDKIVLIKPGQMFVSYRFLAVRWGWKTDKVMRYLKLLKMDKMIHLDATPQGTLLTLVNYGVFALGANTICDTSGDTTGDTIGDTTGDKDNNVENINNGDKIPPTPQGDDETGESKKRVSKGKRGEREWQ